ncbi:arginine--tRNA ligase [Pseudomonas idahonensis]|uniref:arginine--tRNA ligase n=1 Tax=Pseudomonas idahonensis TaxID=2942628 RepID=UPI0035BEE42F
MSVMRILDQRFAAALNGLGATDSPPVIQLASRPEFGDFQMSGVMAAAKKLGLAPRELALQLVERVDLRGIAEHLQIAGPGFINISLSKDFLRERLEHALLTRNLGVEPQPAKRVMVEYASVNLAKEMHVGHLRGSIIGDALARINLFMGQDVILQSHVGDWGTQFGMLLAYMKEATDTCRQDYELRDLNRFYQQAKLRFDESEDFARRARDYVVRLQQGDAEVLRMWHTFVEVSLSHSLDIFQRLGLLLKQSDIRGESFYNDDLQPLVQALQDKGLLTESHGARVVMLAEYANKEGQEAAFIVQKQGGGFLYATTDLAAIRFRIRQLKLDRCLYVVDVRQSLHFQQLFLVARKAGFLPPQADFEHVSHGTIKGADGKPLKTKSGESVKLDALLTEAVERAEVLIAAKNNGLDPEARRHVARVVGIGALKYADLSRHRNTDYVFDWDAMLSFEGNTAPYLQYAYTRANRVLTRAGSVKEQGLQIIEPHEHSLAIELLRFEDVMLQVLRESLPHVLCAYLYGLATAFSRFYESCPVIADERVDGSRLKLCELTARTLKEGLGLLGIEVVDTM